jgi:predicted RNA-binding protein with RPS1 domain
VNCANLAYLEKQWLEATSAREALSNFHKWSAGKRKWVLRHHDEGDISDEETWLRDDFDYLLGFYSLVEIAVTIGFVDELPRAFGKKHLPVLSDFALCLYYEVNYPLNLPRRLRERMQTGLGFRLKPSPGLNSTFYEFLELTKLIERDEDIESFLWALDGGGRDGCNFTKLVKSLKQSRPLLEAVQKPNEDKSELQHALSGFCKFIDFCEGFAVVLSRLDGSPIVAETMWEAHSYWFRQLDSKLGENLKEVIKSLANWRMGMKDKKRLSARTKKLTHLIQELTRPPMTRLKVGLGNRHYTEAFWLEKSVLAPASEVNVEHKDDRDRIMQLEAKIEALEGMVANIEVGEIYHGRVVTLKDFGAFVEVFPGKDGLVHISEWSDQRVNRMENVTKIGDKVWVKCISKDDTGRSKLSRKAAMKEFVVALEGESLSQKAQVSP